MCSWILLKYVTVIYELKKKMIEIILNKKVV